MAGGQGTALASDSPVREAEGPGFLPGFPGTPLCEGALSSDASAHLSLPSTMTSFLTIWLTYYEEDFDDPPEFPALTKLMNFTGQYLPDSTLDRRVNSYSEYLRNLHQAEFQGGGEEDWGGRVGTGWATQIKPPCCWARSTG